MRGAQQYILSLPRSGRIVGWEKMSVVGAGWAAHGEEWAKAEPGLGVALGKREEGDRADLAAGAPDTLVVAAGL